jgi:hypothetical protein
VVGLDPAPRKDSTGFVSHIHFIGGEKGGVGKSVVARLLAQWFIDRSIPFAGVDGDLSHGALVRFYSDYSNPVDLSDVTSADQIFDRALGADRRVLIDLPAQSSRTLWTWMSEANVLSFAREMGVRLSFWHVSDGGYASVGEIEKALDLFGDQIEHKVVRNHGRSKDFSQYDESTARQRLDQLGGKMVDLPALDPAAMYKVDKLGSSFWAAIHSTEGEGLKLLDRQRVRLWLEKCYRQLEPIQDSI